jgi:DNA-binding MarR family transcriptional regulator
MKSRAPDVPDHDPDCAPGSAVLLSRLAKQVYRRSDEQALGMHLRHLVALSYVSDHDGCPQQDLADAFCMDANNVVLLLNELEQLQYAARVRDPHDRRRHLVQITPAGRRALARAQRAQAALEDEVLGALDAQERRTLCELLTRALRSVEPDDGGGLDGDVAAGVGAADSDAGEQDEAQGDQGGAPGSAYSATTASIST